jgi:hypothetical protein
MKISAIVAVIISSASLLSFSACVDEKTQEDWRQEQVNEQLAKIMPIAGTYNGTMSANQDQASLGTVSLTLSPDTDLQPSADNLTSEQHAVVRGTLTYSGINAADVPFDEGFFDPDSGLFQVSISITDSSQVQHMMDLTGNISGNTFTGTIQAEGYPNYAATVSLGKNAALPTVTSTKSLSSGRARLLLSEQNKYTGSFKVSDESSPADTSGNQFSMTIETRDTNPQQQFLDIFLPNRDAQAHVYFKQGSGAEFDTLFPVTIDDQTNSMAGSTTVTDTVTNQTYQTSLEYQRAMSVTLSVDWNCTITTGTKTIQAEMSN